MFKFFLLLVECKHENTPFIFTHIRKHNGISWDVLSQPPYLKKKIPYVSNVLLQKFKL